MEYLRKVGALHEALRSVIAKERPRVHLTFAVGGGGYERAQGIHASELSGCLRQVAHNLLGTPVGGIQQPSVTTELTFAIGHAWHNILQGYLLETASRDPDGATFRPEIKISPEHQELAAHYNIQSHSDGIWRWAAYPDYLLNIEIKSSSKEEFKARKQPEPDHVEQAHIYMGVLRAAHTWFIYIDKESGEFTPSTYPWVVPFRREVWDKLEGRMNLVHHAVAQGQLPEREESWWGCGKCNYAWECQPNVLAKERAYSRDHQFLVKQFQSDGAK